nr:MAG: hypothetical protein DIU57_09580 [Pseudomonadota bacterium]
MGKKKRPLTTEQMQELISEILEATRKVRAAIQIERSSKLSVEMEKATERLNTGPVVVGEIDPTTDPLVKKAQYQQSIAERMAK